MRRAPAHAGSLRPWERSVFVLVFALMLAFVVVVTMSAAKSKGRPRVAAGTPASTSTLKVGATGPRGKPATSGSAAPNSAGATPEAIAPSARLNKVLNATLTGVLGRAAGQLAVGVINESTGGEAVFRGGRIFRAGGLANADLAAALLLQRQRSGQPVSGAESDHAAAMIESGSGASAAWLWHRLHGGLAAANATLKLRHTDGPKPGRLTTTVTDQLQLLTDLAAPESPLGSAGQDYLLGLMSAVEPGQRWGVPAIASAGTSYAVQNGWLHMPGGWAVGSAGIVQRNGEELLIAVLSAGSPSRASGVSLVQSAALAAANAIAGKS